MSAPVTTLLIATLNRHKAAEIRTALGPQVRYLTLRDYSGYPAPEETGTTFAENARLKAEAAAGWLLLKRGTERSEGWAVLADDSGLEVDALMGEPGVQSARFASPELRLPGNAPDAANNEKLLRLMEEVDPARRTARFRCALALTRVRSGLPTVLFEGVCEGVILLSPRGAEGFGYDPLFLPDGQTQTFAELSAAAKNALSHRGKALAALRDHLAGSLVPARVPGT